MATSACASGTGSLTRSGRPLRVAPSPRAAVYASPVEGWYTQPATACQLPSRTSSTATLTDQAGRP